MNVTYSFAFTSPVGNAVSATLRYSLQSTKSSKVVGINEGMILRVGYVLGSWLGSVVGLGVGGKS